MLSNVTPFDFIVFTTHVGLWTLWTLLIKASQNAESNYSYKFVTVVVFTELTKLGLTLCYLLWHYGTNFFTELQLIVSKWRQGIYFAIPALIYAAYNYLFYLNMTLFDPTSYRVLINLRILWSGLLFQFFFGKRLGMMKWAALVLLLVGCAVNQMNSDFQLTTKVSSILFITIQAFTSSLGGVYNEVLLKKEIELDTNSKNMYLYFFSIVINLFAISFFMPELLSTEKWLEGYSPILGAIICVGAICGISTALFLKFLNIILKEYAHTGEIFATALVAYFLFGSPLNPRIFLSLILTAVSVLLYNRAPAVTSVQPSPSTQNEKV